MSANISSLPNLGIASSLTEDERATLFNFGQIVEHPKQSTVVEQGTPHAFLHLILEGELRVIVKSDDAILPLAYVGVGDCVGEMGLLEPVVASATVLATAPTTVWCIDRDQFDQFTIEFPASAAKILKAIGILLSRRLRKGSQRLLDAAD